MRTVLPAERWRSPSGLGGEFDVADDAAPIRSQDGFCGIVFNDNHLGLLIERPKLIGSVDCTTLALIGFNDHIAYTILPAREKFPRLVGNGRPCPCNDIAQNHDAILQTLLVQATDGLGEDPIKVRKKFLREWVEI